MQKIKGDPGAANKRSELTTKYENSMFICVGITWKDGKDSKATVTIGTAFLVRASGVLATNAHVVESLKSADEKYAVQNRTGAVCKIVEMFPHAGYKDSKSPDVALLKIDRSQIAANQPLAELPLATDQDLEKIGAGTQIGTLGYPGELKDTFLNTKQSKFTGVEAVFRVGWIGRMTDYEGNSVGFADKKRILHSACLSQGTSGSPMFTEDGKVVAINNAAVAQDDRSDTHEKEAVPAQIGYAIRVDVLRELLEVKKW
jgi:S1-C subfamily serine protease